MRGQRQGESLAKALRGTEIRDSVSDTGVVNADCADAVCAIMGLVNSSDGVWQICVTGHARYKNLIC